jgi:hypothetical protein
LRSRTLYDDPGIVEPDELRNGRLPFLNKNNNNHKFVNDCRGEEEVWMGKKHLYMDYSQVEVDEMGEIGMVMNDKEDGKNGTIDVEMVKNG